MSNISFTRHKKGQFMQIEKLIDRHYTCVITKDEAIAQGYYEDGEIERNEFLDYLITNSKELMAVQEQLQCGATIGCTNFINDVALVAVIFLAPDIMAIKRDIVDLLLHRAGSDGSEKDFYNLHLMTDSAMLNTLLAQMGDPRDMFEEEETDLLDRGAWDDDTWDNDVSEEFEEKENTSYQEKSGQYRCVLKWNVRNKNASIDWFIKQLKSRKIKHQVFLKDHIGYIVIRDHMSTREMSRLNAIILESRLETAPYTVGAYLEEHYKPLIPEAVLLLME